MGVVAKYFLTTMPRSGTIKIYGIVSGSSEMRILKTKLFHKWAEEIGLEDARLIAAVSEVQAGLCDASLGGCIYKKRVSIKNQGKRDGVRTIIGLQMRERAIFIYGYAKNKRDNITQKEEEALKALAKFYFAYSETQMAKAVQLGELIKVQ